MKTIRLAIVMALLAGSSSMSAFDSGIKVWASAGPNDRAMETFMIYASRSVAFLKDGVTPSSARVQPADFALVTTLKSHYLMASQNTPLWDGMVEPAVNRAERGSRLIFPTRTVSPTAFRLSQVKIVVSSSDPANSLGFQPVLTGFSTEVQGRWYGPDGVKGTSDDVLRTAGGGSELIHELNYTGPGVAYAVETTADATAVRNYINSISDFAVTVRVSVEGTDLVPAVLRVPMVAMVGNLVANVTTVTIVQPNNTAVFLESSPDLTSWSLYSSVPFTSGQQVPVGVIGSRFFRLRN